MTMPTPALPVHPGDRVRLKDIGRDERWLQDWLVEDSTRLGLGSLKIVDQEQIQAGGGILDLLATSGDVYFSIEVQLGEVDASHGFRVLDYWARNRKKQPTKTHIAVLVAESAGGRYRTALEALAEYLPLIVVELRAWRGEDEVVVVPEAVVRNESLDLQDTPLASAEGTARTDDTWRNDVSAEMWKFHEDLVRWVRSALGAVRVDYSPKSYIGLRVGRRVWCPIWPVSNGGTLHLPDPDGSKADASPAYEYFREKLERVGLAVSWVPTYNAGANPITVRLGIADLDKPEVHELLRATYQFLVEKKIWSEDGSGTSPTTPAETGLGDPSGLEGVTAATE